MDLNSAWTARRLVSRLALTGALTVGLMLPFSGPIIDGAFGASPQRRPSSSGRSTDRSLGSTATVATAAAQVCSIPAECNDELPCTADLCLDGSCLHLAIPDCVPCEVEFETCPPAEVVFIMDTSGSMRDEAAALCTGISDLGADLADLGFEITPILLGITKAPGDAFSCLFDTVIGQFGDIVPGPLQDCPFPNGSSPEESWGPATAIVADRFPWTPGATRIIVPISDEGPCNGSRPEGCNDPGDDRNSIDNAIAVANAPDNHVIVAPIAGTNSDACVVSLGTTIATATGGFLYQTKNPQMDFFVFKQDLIAILQRTCVPDDHCEDGDDCTANDRCRAGVCRGTVVTDCKPCTDDFDCDDHSKCTSDSCVDGLCHLKPTYDPKIECCNPAVGTRRSIDDGNMCTADECDAVTGDVRHQVLPAGSSCDDEKTCTVNDACDAAGSCGGTPVHTIPCDGDEDCFGHLCDQARQVCVCNGAPQLCLKPEPGPLPTAGCYSIGDELIVNIEVGNSASIVAGGQFFLEYDPAILEFLDILPGVAVDEDSPFGTELLRAVNETEGTVFYAVGSILGGPLTHGPSIMATLRFRGIEACTTASICFGDDNPMQTRLTDGQGRTVSYIPCCSGELQINGPAPEMNCPHSISVNAELGTLSAEVTWDPFGAVASCGGEVSLTCMASNSKGTNVNDLIDVGGRFPLGISTFSCTAADSCGAVNSCSWDVNVRELNPLEVNVQLSPSVASGPLSRCIEFAFYSTCEEPPVIVEKTISFGLPFNLPGRADLVQLAIPAGQFVCATARDAKHTLRSISPMTIIGGKYYAQFTGDPLQGGNWLLGGNLDGNDVIDAVDQALLMNQYLQPLNPNSPCGSPGFHADINGNGVVNLDDLAFIQRNLLKTDPPLCCPNTSTAAQSSGYEQISLEELSALGYGDLSAADVNRDGMVNRDDLTLFIRNESANTLPKKAHIKVIVPKP